MGIKTRMKDKMMSLLKGNNTTKNITVIVIDNAGKVSVITMKFISDNHIDNA
jgi:hypothetical protein